MRPEYNESQGRSDASKRQTAQPGAFFLPRMRMRDDALQGCGGAGTYENA